MITCEGVTVRIGAKSLLSDVSITVNPGQLCVLVGPNGAGKSTLLHVLAGDRPPTEGAVTALGKRIDAWKPLELARVRAVLPQESSLSFPFTVLEVALLGRGPHVRYTESAHDFAVTRQAIASVGLAPLEHRLTRRSRAASASASSSRGRWRRSAASRRARRGSSCSTSRRRVLDPAHQHSTLQLARSLARDGAAVLAVLHDLNLAAQYADVVALLHQGRLQAFGPPAEVLREAPLSRVFGIPMRVVEAPWAPSRLLIAVEDA